MRSTHRNVHPWRLLLVLTLIGAACASESGSAEVVADQLAAVSAAAEPETIDPPDTDAIATGSWVIEVGDGRVIADADQTICLTLPGGNFIVNGGGDNGFGADFYFSLGSEGGNSFRFEVGGNRTVEVDDSTGGEVHIDYDADSGATIANGLAQNGVPISVTGSC